METASLHTERKQLGRSLDIYRGRLGYGVIEYGFLLVTANRNRDAETGIPLRESLYSQRCQVVTERDACS